MKRLLERCAALDVHEKQLAACVRILAAGGKIEELATEFSTMTSQLLALRDWLKGLGVTHVAMEATGVYFKPVYYALEYDFEVLQVNARHVKKVPGRKTDVKDSEWICQLVECGLLRASFVPPKPIRELRDLTRYRKSLIQERTREAAQRIWRIAPRRSLAQLGELLAHESAVQVRRLGSFFRLV